uniref:Uncharacterized protein n=1 Tax=Anguilla anguilla TaxID=7936 RepID=A0A0E9UQQ2_ANGAN
MCTLESAGNVYSFFHRAPWPLPLGSVFCVSIKPLIQTSDQVL